MEHIVSNRVKTPDGTTLISINVHDYHTYTDKNGETYMVDGGCDYLRRTTGQKEPYTELSVYSNDPHEKIREVFLWGTYGKEGKEPLAYRSLKELSTNHIKAILENCGHVPEWRKEIFSRELEYRK